MHQDDGLEGRSPFVRQLVERLLLVPALPLQGVAGDAGRALEAGVEAQRYVGARLGAATTRQVYVEPVVAVGETSTSGGRTPDRRGRERERGRETGQFSHVRFPLHGVQRCQDTTQQQLVHVISSVLCEGDITSESTFNIK